MRVSHLIKELEQFKAEHGDCDLDLWAIVTSELDDHVRDYVDCEIIEVSEGWSTVDGMQVKQCDITIKQSD